MRVKDNLDKNNVSKKVSEKVPKKVPKKVPEKVSSTLNKVNHKLFFDKTYDANINSFKKVKNRDGNITFKKTDFIIFVILFFVFCVLVSGFVINHEYSKKYTCYDTSNIANEKIGELLDIYREVVDNFYEEVDTSKLVDAGINGMMGFLEDNYSIYMNGKESGEFNEELDGTYFGVGIVVVEGTVVKVYKASPAYLEGIKPGDKIYSINGTKITKDNYDKIASLIYNEKESDFVFLRDDKKINAKMMPKDVDIPSAIGDVIPFPKDNARIGYISISSFTSHSYDDFVEELLYIEKKGFDSLIIDLRDNGGGYLKSAYNISNLFLKEGKVVYSLENKGKKVKYKDDTEMSRDYPIVVLVNDKTASAAEILASALHDSYGAKIVGMKTFGKGKVQTVKSFKNSIVKYTSAKWLRPNGECIDGKGIIPDYEVKYVPGKDTYQEQMNKAIEILLKKS